MSEIIGPLLFALGAAVLIFWWMMYDQKKREEEAKRVADMMLERVRLKYNNLEEIKHVGDDQKASSEGQGDSEQDPNVL